MKQGGNFLLEPVVGTIFTREMFSEEQREIDQMVREFARDKIFPRKDELAAPNQEFTRELMREVGELGLLGVDVPEKYGGVELDKTTSALVVEALSVGGSSSFVVTFSAHSGIGTLPIVYFGAEAQKEKHLPKLASGEHLGAYALTEPDAGSDASNIKTTAKLSDDGEEYILNGAKQYITNGGWADVYIVFAQVDGKISAFVVERGSPGLSTGAEEHKPGIKGSSTVTVFLEDVHVPQGSLLGRPGDGLSIALNILNIGRFKLGAADLGGCKVAINNATQYALERIQFGQPIAYFEAIRKKLADMVTRTYMLDSAIYRTVGMMDERISRLDHQDPRYNSKVMAALEEYAIEASIAKVLGSEIQFEVVDHGVQIYGGYGYSEDYPMAGAYRDCRIDRIYEGTNEINRMVIYGYYLKKALTEELSVRDAEKGWLKPVPGESEALQWEIRALDTARRMTLKYLHQAVTLYGQDLRNKQIVGEDLADLVIGYFAASSAVNRLLQLGDEALADRAHQALARLTVATYLEHVCRLSFRLRPVLFADKFSEGIKDSLDKMSSELHLLPFDPVEEIHVLTDELFHHGQYNF